MVLVGPCLFVAPLLVLLVPVALVVWPVAVVALGTSWLIVWPMAFIAARMGGQWLPARHRTLGRWCAVGLRPWNYFDVPKGDR